MPNVVVWLLCYCLVGLFTCSLFAQKKKPVRILQHSASITLFKLDQLSSSAREANLSLTPDANTVYFTSNRGGMSWSRYDETQSRYDSDIFTARRADGLWNPPRPIDLDTEYEEEAATVAPDAQSIVYVAFRTGWEESGGPFFNAELRGKKWEAPVGLGGGLTKFFVEMNRENNGLFITDGMTVSPDGNTLVFVAGVPGKKSNFEVYRSRKSADGVWSEPTLLPISTPKQERGVFLAADGKTLYFSSNGYNSLGGFDIYKTTLNDDGTTSDMMNLGAPINSPTDETSFALSADGNEALIVRDGDIYRADLTLAATELKPRPVVMMRGIVRDKTTQKPVDASVELTESDDASAGGSASASLTIIARTNPLNGEYSAILKPGKKYVQSVFSSKYKSLTREFEVSREDREPVVTDIELEPRPPKIPKTSTTATLAAKGAKGTAGKSAGSGIAPVLKPIYFDSDQFAVAESDYDELDKVAEFFRSNPDFQVEIFGYADDRGSFEYNLRLSQRRVNEVVEYLLSTGCERKQLVLQWFGEDEPLAPNTTDGNRSKNRRVELRFFKKAPELPVPPGTKTPAKPTPKQEPLKTTQKTPAVKQD